MPGQRRELRGWSYSAWSSLKTCPFRFEQTNLLGLKGPKSWFLEKGIADHKIAEQYLRKQISKLPKAFSTLEKAYRQLLREDPVVEKFWGVDKKFRDFEPDLSRGERSWVVMKMDAAVLPTKKEPMLFIQDLKTGRIYDSHVKQGGLYACIGAAKYECDGVDVEFWYKDQQDDPIRSFHFTPKRLKTLTELWTERGKEVMSPRKKYKPTPSVEACKYCHLKTSEGGTCKAWREVM